MARTALTVQDVPGKYPGSIGVNAADFTWAAADIVDQNSFPCTGREIVLVRNDNVGPQTVTINSVADPYKRTQDVTAYSVGIGEYAFFGPFPVVGWRQADGNVYLEASAADVFFAVVRLPSVI